MKRFMGMPRERLQAEVDDFQRSGEQNFPALLRLGVRPCLRRCRSSFGPRCASYESLRWLLPPAHPLNPGPTRSAPTGKSRPPSGRPPRARWFVRGVASAPCVGVVVRQINVNCCLRRAPAQRTIGGVGRVGVCVWWGFTPWWLSPVGSFSSPGTGGDQEPGGGATGDSPRGC